MKVLVTGSSGFIGADLCKQLRKRGYHVFEADNGFSNKSEIHPSSKVDINSGEFLNFIKKVDFVIHLAAVSGVEDCNKYPEEALKTNIEATYKIALECAKNKIPLIFSSSASTYNREINSYAMMKDIGASMIETICNIYNSPAIVFNIGNVFGSYRINGEKIIKNTAVNKFLNQSKEGEVSIYKPGHQTRDFVLLIDVVNAFISGIDYLIKNKGFHKINLGTGKLTRIDNLAKRFANQFGAKIKWVDNPRKEVIEMDKLDVTDLHEKLGIYPTNNFPHTD